MGYEHLQNTLKAIALTVPAARAFEMTVVLADLPAVTVMRADARLERGARVGAPPGRSP